MATWNPDLYLRFAAERTRPSMDLVARIEVAPPARVIDLGCGPGNSTAVLRGRWPEAEIVGLDSDPAMLAAARESNPSGRWTHGDAASWNDPAAWDVVFSNAMLQWLPDHERHLRRYLEAVRPGGALAVQVPTHLYSPLHRAILAVADEPPWRERLAEARHAIVSNDAAYYYDAVCDQATRVDIWETEYGHVMPGPEGIVTWIRGTGLRPFLAALADESERSAFERRLLAKVAESYPPRRDGQVLFPFRRLFLVAYR